MTATQYTTLTLSRVHMVRKRERERASTAFELYPCVHRSVVYSQLVLKTLIFNSRVCRERGSKSPSTFLICVPLLLNKNSAEKPTVFLNFVNAIT